MYTDCIHKQKELERDKEEEMEDEEKVKDPKKLNDDEPKKKRKRNEIKVHTYNF